MRGATFQWLQSHICRPISVNSFNSWAAINSMTHPASCIAWPMVFVPCTTHALLLSVMCAVGGSLVFECWMLFSTHRRDRLAYLPVMICTHHQQVSSLVQWRGMCGHTAYLDGEQRG